MRRQALVTWVCDRCGAEEVEPAGKVGPDGWRVAIREQITRRNDMTGIPWFDLCDICVASYREWWRTAEGGTDR